MGEWLERLERDDASWRTGLAAILLAALALRLWIAYGSGLPWLTPDSLRYLEMAAGIRTGSPLAAFPNGYPLLIAALGVWLPEAQLPAVLIGINGLASTLNVGLGAELARRATGSRAGGLLAAAILCLHPNQLVYAHYVLTEPLATSCVLGGCLALLRGRAAASGLLLGCALTLRSVLAPLVFGVLTLVAASPRRRRQALALGAGLAVVGCAYGSLAALGTIRTGGNAGINLLFSINARSNAFAFDLEGLTPEQRAHPWRTYLAFARDEPGEFATQRLFALWELWGPYPTDSERTAFERIALGTRFPLLLLAIAGFAQRRGRFEARILAVSVAAHTAVHTAFFGQPRFTYVVEPAVVALAAIPLLRALEKLAARTRTAAEPRGLPTTR